MRNKSIYILPQVSSETLKEKWEKKKSISHFYGFHFVIIWLSLFLSININGREMDRKEVVKFAQNWLLENEYVFHYGEYKNSSVKFELKSVKSIMLNDDRAVLFVAELNPVGFILIANDNRLKPIIGYSAEKDFNYKNAQKDLFLNAIISDLDENLERMEKENRSFPSKDWVEYSTQKKSLNKTKEVDEIIGPFLESDWGQGYVRLNGNYKPVYNFYTPDRWPAGCVSTSVVQILNYYKWPIRGEGKHGYYDNGQYLSADYGNTIYDWDNTLDKYEDVNFSIDNQKAAGLITYHAGVALEMDYEYNGSTSETADVPGILQDYFRASGHYKSVTASGFWDEIKNNILDKRPAILSIKSTQHSVGHTAVVDGYFETNNYYHLNPGWYGDYNGWYNISGDWQMESYNIVVGVAKGIVPSPMINEIELNSSNSYLLSWSTSRYQNADYYELQQSNSLNGNWVTLSNSISDTSYQINDVGLTSFYYRVRANRDNIWWDFSEIKEVKLGTERSVTFQVDMTYYPMEEGDSLVIRGNTLPLAGNINSSSMIKTDSTNIYRLTLNFDYDYVGKEIIYRYFIQSQNNLIPESKNRKHLITTEQTQIIAPTYFDDIVSVDEDSKAPSSFKLEQNYPNPFNPSTTIQYTIKERGYVTLKVYNILGQNVETLVNREQSAGSYNVLFNANHLPNGLYFYQIKTNVFTETRKMSLIK
ncbi:MAG: C10 family peptidase [Melioribacteraceae bacterium]|nr:C10 family peptidase [Melioribacteraceae bacterium]